MLWSRVVLPVCLLASWIAGVQAQSLQRVADSVVDGSALIFTQGTWGVCVNGQSFQQDALSSFNGWQYATYYDAGRRLCLARRPGYTSGWEVFRFADYQFKGNDTHNVAVLGICPADGTIHLAFDHHGHPLRYRVSRPGVALQPGKFAWSPELFGATTNTLEPAKPLLRVTYPRFVRTPEGGLQFGCRVGGSGNGEKCLADYVPASRRWENFGAFLGGGGRYGESTSRNAYLNGLTYDRQGRLHVTWCWRETGNPMTNHDLGYSWSKDRGRNWFDSAGTPVGRRGAETITVDSAGARVVELGMNRGLINATTQAADSRGRIHLATFHLPDATPAQSDWETTRRAARFFHYWRNDRGDWQRNEMPFVGSRPQLWLDTADNAYLVFVGDRFTPSPFLTIAAASAKKRWTDWRIIHEQHGPFAGQPQVDRYAAAGVLSVYIQEEARGTNRTASALRVFTFKSVR
jgi:hypothetical protein